MGEAVVCANADSGAKTEDGQTPSDIAEGKEAEAALAALKG